MDRSYRFNAADQAMTHYFDEESKVWKPLQAVPDVGEGVCRWFCVEYIRNYLYLVAGGVSYFPSQIYRYHITTKSWEKLPQCTFHGRTHCLCSVGNYVYVISESDPPQVYSLADNTWEQGSDNLDLFKQRGLSTVAAAVMNSKLYVLHGFNKCSREFPYKYSEKPALVHCFDPTKNEWENVPSTCYPHFGSSLIVVNNRLYVAGGFKEVCNDSGQPCGENAPVEVFQEKKRLLPWFGRGKAKQPPNSWSVVEQKHIPANNLGAVEIEGRVYFIINKFPVDSRIRIQPEDKHPVNLDEWKNLTTVSELAVLCYVPLKKEDLQ